MSSKLSQSAATTVDESPENGPLTWDGDLSWDDADDLGTDVFQGGFSVVKKAALVGKAFLIGGLSFRKGEFGNYVTARAVNKKNEEFIFNDGSTGVYRQLVKYLAEKGEVIPDTDPEGMYTVRLKVQGGLRVSNYEHKATGKTSATYYLA